MQRENDMWDGRSVFVTGHTGFKGGWLSLLLADRGARVHGYALAAPTTPNFFATTRLDTRLTASTLADIRDQAALRSAMIKAQPEVIFHLAAQPLVRQSYRNAIETFDVNVMGTARLLELARGIDSVRAVVVVTTDKCYDNKEWERPYRESDPLGGHDPYSASKACAELLSHSYRQSFLADAGVSLATARAGNVIGGGDWAADRLVPDFLRALDENRRLTLRYPDAIRPWQHVLEPVSGYVLLAEAMLCHGAEFAEAWNFGPDESDTRSVRWIADRLSEETCTSSWEIDRGPKHHEATLLMLDSSKAKHRLGWKPRWPLDEALRRTVAWHQHWKKGLDMAAFSSRQIADFDAAASLRRKAA
jgi:CDP-glucose 4,6-dehydratase